MSKGITLRDILKNKAQYLVNSRIVSPSPIPEYTVKCEMDVKGAIYRYGNPKDEKIHYRKSLLRVPWNVSEYEIQEGTQVIANEAFAWCSKLKKITIPESVNFLGGRVFMNAEQLEEIQFANNVKIEHFGENVFSGCKCLKHVDMPKQVDISWDNTALFSGCSNLEHFTFPVNTYRIQHSCFEGCISLKTIEIPNTVKFISASAFRGCRSLKYIFLDRETPPEIYNPTYIVLDNTILLVPYTAIQAYLNLDEHSNLVPKSNIKGYYFPSCYKKTPQDE